MPPIIITCGLTSRSRRMLLHAPDRTLRRCCCTSDPWRAAPSIRTNLIFGSDNGKGAWRDNVFVERLWRSIKYEEVYLRAYESVSEARTSIGRYLDFYNGRRPHSSLDGTTPDQAYFTQLPLRLAA